MLKNALQKIFDGQVEGTGNHIITMQKDLMISMSLGKEMGVLLHTAAAMQIFHTCWTKYPNGDNWVCTLMIVKIIDAELHRGTSTETCGLF